MKVATWNVNGIRARYSEVVAWVAADRPDLFCLQEIKAAAAQVPEPLTGLPDYYNGWHGAPNGYSGVSLHVRRDFVDRAPVFFSPDFDFEKRVVAAEVFGVQFLSTYVPNGGRDFGAKKRFLRDLVRYCRERSGPVVICGDLNVTRDDRDVHRSMRSAEKLGQRSEERALLAELLETGLVDLLRAAHPDSDDVFSWWPPWRDERARNRGWRIDYVLADASLVASPVAEVRAVTGTSDHAPVVAELELLRSGR